MAELLTSLSSIIADVVHLLWQWEGAHSVHEPVGHGGVHVCVGLGHWCGAGSWHVALFPGKL